MNELQVETIKLEPAKIEFNHEQIEKELTANLEKYQNLTFTEENTSEVRKVLAELRKGKNAINRYRIDTKKQLTVSIDDFENKCKELTSKFDNVINPLDQQLKDFTQAKRDEKREHLEKVRKELLAESGLEDKYAEQVEIEDSYLNASTSYKQATDSMEFVISSLKSQQQAEQANKQVIDTSVRLANAENDLSLSAEAYVRLLEFNEIEDVQEQIKNDVNKAVSEREKEAERKRIEEEKKAEQERIEKEKAEQELIEKEERKQEIEVVEEIEEPKITHEVSLDDIPFNDTETTENYTISATKEQHEALQKYLDENNIDWNIEMGLPF